MKRHFWLCRQAGLRLWFEALMPSRGVGIENERWEICRETMGCCWSREQGSRTAPDHTHVHAIGINTDAFNWVQPVIYSRCACTPVSSTRS